jgi:hypothetical protein
VLAQDACPELVGDCGREQGRHALVQLSPAETSRKIGADRVRGVHGSYLCLASLWKRVPATISRAARAGGGTATTLPNKATGAGIGWSPRAGGTVSPVAPRGPGGRWMGHASSLPAICSQSGPDSIDRRGESRQSGQMKGMNARWRQVRRGQAR